MKTIVKVGAEFDSSSPFLFYNLGSCFVSNLSPYLERWGLPSKTNPLGTSFNPISIAKQLRWTLDPKTQLSPLFEFRGQFHQLDAAAKFNANQKQSLHNQLLDLQQEAHSFIQQTHHKRIMILSFGTAHAWFKEQTLVNNCHKLPGALFERRRLTQEEIVAHWKELIIQCPEDISFIFTVSPVRYTKIGLEENFIGKSILRLAIEELTTEFSNCHYFPSYEILSDELRDYSFYASNGTHPNEEGVQVVMEKFKTYLGL